MKTIKIILIMAFVIQIFFLNPNEIFSQPGWILRSTAVNVNSVFFINPVNGWIAGDSGLIYATYDGGYSWSGLNGNTATKINSIYFRDEYTGWAAGNGGIIIKTLDGGNNWTVIPTGVTWNITSIHFPTPDTGYASGEKNLKSTDGGLTWSELSVTLFSNSAYFINGTTGFYVNTSNIFKTTTAGAGWFSQILSGSYNSVYFTNSNTGWVSGSGIRYTTNAGTNWTAQTTGAGFSTLYGINFSDASTGWSVGSLGTIGGNSEIRRTTNAGTNWIGQSSGTTNILRSVSAITSSKGVTTGDAGTILLTTNSGTNWTNTLSIFSTPSNPVYSLQSVCFADNNTGYAGGQVGIMNKTTNGGTNWTSYTTASFNHIYAVHFLGNDTGWIAGAGGMIQITNNGGVNWSSLSSGTSENINDLFIGRFSLSGFFGLYKIGWCVTNSGGIYKTTDGGANWSGQISPTSANLYSVVCFSENNAIACGDSGKILKTTNGGLNWSTTVSGVVGGALRAIAFADNNYGICVGDSATVLYTTDQGSSWTLDISGPRSITKKNLYGVSARMPSMASYTAVGEEGVILKTDDEGGSWIMLSGGIKTKLFAISTPSDDISYIAGTKGTVLKTVDGGALPVELISLNYSLHNNDIILSWMTSNEINNKGFDIERKKSGESWLRIGFVKGSGSTPNHTTYSFTDKNLTSGKYRYRLKQTDFNGNFEYFNLNSEIDIESFVKYELYQNYPNPFNPSTNIKYDIHEYSNVKIKVYDAAGKEIKTLVNEFKQPGSYTIRFNAENLASGVYFYTLEAGGIKKVNKFILLK